jgi:hypothetical protein
VVAVAFVAIPSSVSANGGQISKPPGTIVRIEPETLNHASKGVFTAFITLPEGYEVADIDVSTVECEGARAAEKGIVAGDTLIVKFNRQDLDLKLVKPGDAVMLIVTGTLKDTDGTLFKASDTIRVIDKGGK